MKSILPIRERHGGPSSHPLQVPRSKATFSFPPARQPPTRNSPSARTSLTASRFRNNGCYQDHSRRGHWPAGPGRPDHHHGVHWLGEGPLRPREQGLQVSLHPPPAMIRILPVAAHGPNQLSAAGIGAYACLGGTLTIMAAKVRQLHRPR